MQNLIRRQIYSKLEQDLESPKITILTGPRQAGKTTLVKLLIKKLQKQGKPCLYLNLDQELDFKQVASQQKFRQYLKLELGLEVNKYSVNAAKSTTAQSTSATTNTSTNTSTTSVTSALDQQTTADLTTRPKPKVFVFIDEIQRKKNAGLFLKGLYDSGLPIKLFVTGSGSIGLKQKISEGLAGRKKTFHLKTVSFLEFINYRTDYRYRDNDKVADFFQSDLFEESLLHEYLQFGGYPEVLTSARQQDKQEVMESIYDSLVDKDLKQWLQIRNPGDVIDLLAYLSVQTGQQTIKNKLATKIGVSYKTADKYLHYLQRIYILQQVRPFFRNRLKEVTQTPIYYFTDLGMRNFVFNRLTHFNPVVSGGMLFQNLVLRILSECLGRFDIKYWRTQQGAEMDFVIRCGEKLLPFEVKFSHLQKTGLSRAIHSFIKRYHPQQLWVVNLSLTAERQVGETRVKFIPFYELYFESFVEGI